MSSLRAIKDWLCEPVGIQQGGAWLLLSIPIGVIGGTLIGIIAAVIANSG